MAETVVIKGLAELEQNLRMLGDEMRERGVKLMMSRAAVPMRDDARRRTPVLVTADPRRKAGTVRDAIKIWRHRKTPYAATYYVGVRRLSGSRVRAFKRDSNRRSTDNQDDPFYWRFLEFGTSRLRARPFLRPAFEARKGEAAQTALIEGRKYIERVARKFKRLKAV